MAGRFEEIMSLQNALSRLRNQEHQQQSCTPHQKKPMNETTPQVSGINSVFSLDETGNDIFDIDNDIFGGSAGAIFSTSFNDEEQYNHNKPKNEVPCSLNSHNSSPIINTDRPSLTLVTRNATDESNSSVINRTLTKKAPQTFPNGVSPDSLEKVKKFASNRESFSKKRKVNTNSNSEGHPPQFNPPTKKRVNLSNSLFEDNEHEMLDKRLLEAFISDPDEMVQDKNSKPSRNPETKTNYRNTIHNDDPSTSIFKIPTKHPLRSTFSRSLSTEPSTPELSVRSSLQTPTQVSTSTHSTGRQIHSLIPCPSSTSASTPLLPLPRSSFSTPQCSHHHTVVSVRRKFPGPAGILPALVAGQSMDGIVIPTPSFPTPASTPRVKSLLTTPSKFHTTSAQHTQDGGADPLDFSQGPWISMLQDLDMNDEYSAPLLKYTIARAVKQASRQQLKNGKVAHLRVLLKSIVPACRNTSAVLKDPTGEMLCTIHQSVMDEHCHELQPGAVLILRQATVISPAPRRHYLSITPDNIVIIYPTSSDTNNTSSSARTICLTEVEKRFRDQSLAKENNSPHNSSQLSSTYSQPPLRTEPHWSTESSQSDHMTSASPREQPSRLPNSIPFHLQDHHTARGTQQPFHPQASDTVFSGQLCEDEFDAIMGCIDGGLDF